MSVATAFLVSQSLDTMDLTSINTIRTLAMDGVQAANSGHPGTPMAMAPVAYCLWQKFLRFDPQDPVWPNRDLPKEDIAVDMLVAAKSHRFDLVA